MISIKRIEEGKIIHENFKNDINLIEDGWAMHPSVGRFFINKTEGVLNILHGQTPTYLLRDLTEKAILEVNNTYNPIEEYEMGGMVAYVADNHKLELYEYFNPDLGTTLTFPYIRLIKNGAYYEGYGSQDGVNWDIRGTIDFIEANKWGVCLEGLDSLEGQVMKIHTISLYKDTKIFFKALPVSGRVEVWNMSNTTPLLIDTVKAIGYEAEMSIFNLPMPIHVIFKIYNDNNTLVSQGEFAEVFGGDVFHCGNFLDVYYNDKPLDLLNNNFGYIDSFYKDFKLELRNMINVPHKDVNIEIKKYHEEFGWEWVEICEDFNGVPSGGFRKVITMDEIPGDGNKFFWVRITRSTIPIEVDDYLFDFVINIW